ncbi:MAG: glycerate kinase [Bacteroidales bacterium]|jgi:glycerate kinase|nr:glycerate kinase [Bacteroidales bacterium]
MKIVVAPNSMKGSIDAFRFAEIVEKAFLNCSQNFEIRKIPVADGGDFTGEVIQRRLGAEKISVEVTGPLGEKTVSKYFISGQKAIIEMADASGMKLIKEQNLNPLKASSFGTGELISDAISKGCTKILMAIGGSATVDGGMGMLEALGFKFLSNENKNLRGNGENLTKIYHIEKGNFPENVSMDIICDVNNPLLGCNGAATVFAPQKGATPEMVIILEKGLKNWSEIIFRETGKDFSIFPGAGAAGGIPISLLAFCNAEIVPGAEFVLSQLNFDEHAKWADIIITGEGKIDKQTFNNKAPMVVAAYARKYGKPVFAIAGMAEKKASCIFDGVFSFVSNKVSLSHAISNAEKLLFNFSSELAKNILNRYDNEK